MLNWSQTAQSCAVLESQVLLHNLALLHFIHLKGFENAAISLSKKVKQLPWLTSIQLNIYTCNLHFVMTTVIFYNNLKRRVILLCWSRSWADSLKPTDPCKQEIPNLVHWCQVPVTSSYCILVNSELFENLTHSLNGQTYAYLS